MPSTAYAAIYSFPTSPDSIHVSSIYFYAMRYLYRLAHLLTLDTQRLGAHSMRMLHKYLCSSGSYAAALALCAQAPAGLTARTKEQPLGTALFFCLYPQNAAPCFLTPSDARWVTATCLLPSLPILIYE